MNSHTLSNARKISALAFIAALATGCSGGTQGSNAKEAVEASTKMAKIGVSFQDEESVIAFKPQEKEAGQPKQEPPGQDKQEDRATNSVMVNIASIALRAAGEDGPWMTLGKPSQAVDLMKLKSGFPLPISEGELEIGTTISEIRLVLEEEGNFLTREDGSICELKTPSAQKSGLKLKLEVPVVAEADRAYSILFDFDSRKSIVLQGNGGCLLKPVLKKVKINSEIVFEEPNDDSDDDSDDDSGTPEPTPYPDTPDDDSSL